MKKRIILLTAISFINFSSCTTSDDGIEAINASSSSNSIDVEIKCGFHNGNQLWKGPQGGCYYYNSNGNKTYVERSECDC